MDSLFNIGLPELIFILLLAGLVMGPERIRQVARWLGKVTAQTQAISRAFVRQLDSELDAVEKGELKAAVSDIQSLQQEIEQLRRELRSAPAVLGRNVQQTTDEARSVMNGSRQAAVTPADDAGDSEAATAAPATASAAPAEDPDDIPSIAPPRPASVPDDPAL